MLEKAFVVTWCELSTWWWLPKHITEVPSNFHTKRGRGNTLMKGVRTKLNKQWVRYIEVARRTPSVVPSSHNYQFPIGNPGVKESD